MLRLDGNVLGGNPSLSDSLTVWSRTAHNPRMCHLSLGVTGCELPTWEMERIVDWRDDFQQTRGIVTSLHL